MRRIHRALFATLAFALFAAPVHAADRYETEDGPLVVHPIHHATVVLEWGETTIYVDPVGGADRFDEHDPPDLVLLTDVHGDHLHQPTLKAVRGPSTKLVAPQAVAKKLSEGLRRRTTVLDNGEKTKVAGAGIKAIPMYNLTEERKKFHPKGRGNGYVLTLADTRVYLSGDTEDIPEMRRLKNIDVAFVCMNLPYTMSVDTAADAVLDFRPDVVYPYHYRGRDGRSDVGRFKETVTSESDVTVHLRNWYSGG